MDVEPHMFHCLLIFNNQNEPLLTIFDEYIESLVISPHRTNHYDTENNLSMENIIMQRFIPLLASQSALFDTISARFYSIELYNNKTLIMTKLQNCYIVILLSENCIFKRQKNLIKKKIDLIEWIICSFYGICWHKMIQYNNYWLKTILKEMWLMDENEFNLSFWSVEKIDLSPHLKLSEKVLEILKGNSKFLKQVNERKMKHQLILVGSKLFSLYTSDLFTSLKPKNTLLFVLICNAIFNRFSKNREIAHEMNTTHDIIKPSSIVIPKNKSMPVLPNVIFSDKNQERKNSLYEIQTRTPSKSSSLFPQLDSDPFIVWIENKDFHKYRIVKIFLNYRTGFLTPCHLHLIKLARNIIYIGVEDNLENHDIVSTLDKSIRLLRNLLLDNDKRKDVTFVLKSRMSQSIDKLINLKIINWQQLLKQFKLCLSKESKNFDFLDRVLKELLRIFEQIYCQYYLHFPIKINEKLCKCFLRCFIEVKKEMSDFLSILSVKALRNLPQTSFYSIYPGLINFVFTNRKLDQSLISPVIEKEILNDGQVAELHFLIDMCRNIGTHFDVSLSWKQIEVCNRNFRCTYHRKSCRVSEVNYEVELTVFHFSSVSSYLAKKQLQMLFDQLLLDYNGAENSLINLTR